MTKFPHKPKFGPTVTLFAAVHIVHCRAARSRLSSGFLINSSACQGEAGTKESAKLVPPPPPRCCSPPLVVSRGGGGLTPEGSSMVALPQRAKISKLPKESPLLIPVGFSSGAPRGVSQGKHPLCQCSTCSMSLAHLVNPKFFVAAHCGGVWVTVLWGTTTCIPCTHGRTFCSLSLKWNLIAQPCFPLGQHPIQIQI